MQRTWRRRWKRLSKTILPPVAAGMMVVSSYTMAYANPTGGTVTSGSATINSGGSTMIINQTTNQTAINWQSFNIGSGETVRFVQPSVSSVALNRVVGTNVSSIYGMLSANGKVYLINPNGILFAPGAQINTGALVASTLNISDSDFRNGNYRFTNSGSAGSVTNQGVITATNEAVLVGPKVQNDGVIVAKVTGLAAGNKVSLDFNGDNLINVAVDTGAAGGSAVNTGTITSPGGLVMMSAGTKDALLNTVVNNSGVIRAQSLNCVNGVIRLEGGTVTNSGTLDASGKISGQTGGTVKVLGDTVNLASGATVTVSGDVGGGTAFIGGAQQGGANTYAATTTTVQQGATIDADAITSGNGGNVVVWANDTTNFAGTITARGGVLSGNGGNVETSGKYLSATGTVLIGASNGKGGSWLLDPTSFTIDTATANSLQTALNGGGSVTVTSNDAGSTTGSGDINVDAAVTWHNGSLTLTADRNVNINAVMTADTSASLALNPALSGGTISCGFNSDGTFKGKVDFSGSGVLNINGTPYTVIHSVGAGYNSTTGIDLQGINGNLSGHYVLGTDINASVTSGWNSGSGFLPISTFTGAFDGLGHTITGLTISSSTINTGLFGSSSGTIRNVGLSGGNVSSTQRVVGGLVGSNTGTVINCYNRNVVSGNVRVGGLVGYNTGDIANSYNGGAVSSTGVGDANVVGGLLGDQSGGTISNSYNTGVVTSYYSSGVSGYQPNYVAGGLIGGSWAGSIIDCYNSGNVSGSSTVGGLVGVSFVPISNSRNSGTITATSNDVGGLVGVNYGTITGGHNTGNVSAANSHDVYSSTASNDIGGLVGTNNYDATHTGSIISSDSTGNVTGTGWVGGLVGYNSTGTFISGSNSTGTVNGYYSVGGLAGTNAGGSIDGSYSTGSVSGANRIGGLAGKNSGTITSSHSDSSVTRSGNIALTDTNEGLAVGGLVGYNVGSIDDSHSSGAVISDDIGVIDVTGVPFGLKSFVGGLVGNNWGTIGRSYSTGNVTDQASNGGSIYTYAVGGLVGYNKTGAIINSYASGNVTENGADGGSNSSRYIGGLAAYNDGGTVSGSNYHTGTIANSGSGANIYIGGLIGYNAAGTISNGSVSGGGISKAATPTTGAVYAGGFVGSNYGSIDASTSDIAIRVSNTGSIVEAGGLVGANALPSATISNSSSTGAVTVTNGFGVEAGGLVGTNLGTITSSYSTGNVSGKSSTMTTFGGLVGNNIGRIENHSYSTGTVTDNSDNNPNGESNVGGLAGINNTGATITDSYSTGQLISTSGNGYNYVGGLVGINSHGAITGSYNTGSVSDTVSSYFNAVGGLVGINYGSIETSYNTGTIHGSGSGAYNYFGGLAGNNYTGGTIKTSYNTGSVFGMGSGTNNFVGGLVGFHRGLSIEKSYNTGSVTAGSSGTYNYAGGLVGFNRAQSIEKSYNTGSVTVGSSGTYNYAGGLVGQNNGGTLLNTYNQGTVNNETGAGTTYTGGLVAYNGGGLGGGSIQNSYNAGLVSGNGYVGGLIGVNPAGSDLGAGLSGGSIVSSYWDTNASGQTVGVGSGSAAGASGKSTELMVTDVTYSGWDIAKTGGSSAVWRIYNGYTYPLLRNFLTSLTVTADTVTKTYDGAAVDGSGMTYSTGARPSNVYGTLYGNGGVNAGVYAPSGLYSSQQGYDITYVNGTLTVNPAPLTITANNVSKTYDGFAYTGNNGVSYNGFVNHETSAVLTGTVAYGGNAQGAINAGSYTLTPSGLSSGNYDITYVNGVLTVNPASLTITANSTTKTFGQAIVFNGTEFTASGLQNGETVGAVTLSSAGSSATANVVGSPYVITPSAATGGTFTAGNYTITYVNGILIVNDNSSYQTAAGQPGQTLPNHTSSSTNSTSNGSPTVNITIQQNPTPPANGGSTPQGQTGLPTTPAGGAQTISVSTTGSNNGHQVTTTYSVVQTAQTIALVPAAGSNVNLPPAAGSLAVYRVVNDQPQPAGSYQLNVGKDGLQLSDTTQPATAASGISQVPNQGVYVEISLNGETGRYYVGVSGNALVIRPDNDRAKAYQAQTDSSGSKPIVAVSMMAVLQDLGVSPETIQSVYIYNN